MRSFLAASPRAGSGERLLRLIRDAQVADGTYLLNGVLDDVATEDYGSDSMVGWQAPYLSSGRIAHVSRPGQCIHDLSTMYRLPKGGSFEGAGLVEEPVGSCWATLVVLWRAYRATGSQVYLDAATAAWGWMLQVAPREAAYARTHRRLAPDDPIRLR